MAENIYHNRHKVQYMKLTISNFQKLQGHLKTSVCSTHELDFEVCIYIHIYIYVTGMKMGSEKCILTYLEDFELLRLCLSDCDQGGPLPSPPRTWYRVKHGSQPFGSELCGLG